MNKSEFLKDLESIGLRDIVMKEIVLAYERIKPASRIFVSEDKFPYFESFCGKYCLFIEKGSYKIVGNRDIGKSGWQNKIKMKVSVRSKKGMLPYYISKDRKIAKRARDAESKKDDTGFGKELGFPVCCQKFFKDNYEEANSKQCDFSLFTLRGTKGDYPYNAYNNYVAQYFGFSLLSHFPCSFNCKNSARLARRYYNLLSKYSKSWANKFLNTQKSAILFTEYRGIFLIRKFRYKDGILMYHSSSLEATLKNKLYQFLSKADTLRVVDKNHIMIQRHGRVLKELKGENYGLMVFR